MGRNTVFPWNMDPLKKSNLAYIVRRYKNYNKYLRWYGCHGVRFVGNESLQ